MAKRQLNQPKTKKKLHDSVLYSFQGGGALGAYQAGVASALHEANYEPNWILGTSIGAINAAILAGNKPADRIDKLNNFWDYISTPVNSSAAAVSTAVAGRARPVAHCRSRAIFSLAVFANGTTVAAALSKSCVVKIGRAHV